VKKKFDVSVTLADVRDYVVDSSTSVPGVLVDGVAEVLDAKLQLVGDHTPTTILTPTTIQYWIAHRVKEVLGGDGYDRILQANVG
jgi:hypothetical protein